MRNSLTILNEMGDVCISWDESNDEKMIALIRKKMSEGMTFFIVEPKFLGFQKEKKPLKSVIEVGKNRKVWLKDEDFSEVMGTKGVTEHKRVSFEEIETKGILTKPEDAKNKHVVAVAPRRGG